MSKQQKKGSAPADTIEAKDRARRRTAFIIGAVAVFGIGVLLVAILFLGPNLSSRLLVFLHRNDPTPTPTVTPGALTPEPTWTPSPTPDVSIVTLGEVTRVKAQGPVSYLNGGLPYLATWTVAVESAPDSVQIDIYCAGGLRSARDNGDPHQALRGGTGDGMSYQIVIPANKTASCELVVNGDVCGTWTIVPSETVGESTSIVCAPNATPQAPPAPTEAPAEAPAETPTPLPDATPVPEEEA
jgi:hypothetical protein